MLGLGRAVRVYVYAGTCDMRRQMNGLSTMVREQLGRDPLCGDLFVFRNRRGDMIKILFYDRGGYCLLAKRLEEGTFRIALSESSSGASVEITHRELASLLANAELVQNPSRST